MNTFNRPRSRGSRMPGFGFRPSEFFRVSVFEFRISAVAPLLLLLLLPVSATAGSSPFLIPYQGRLTNPQGVPYTNGQYTLAFTLYDQPVGGTVKWGPETHYRVGVINGMVNLFLGSINTISNVDFSQTLHLGITIYVDNNPNNPAPEMVPRQMIIPSFWSKYSENSGTLAGYNWTPLFGVNSPSGSLPASKLADGSLPGSKIQGSSITAAQIAPTTITAAQIAPQTITSNQIANATITVAQLSAQLVLDSIVPPGTMVAFGGTNIPGGWLLCDGTALSSANYPRLYAAISTNWGIGATWNGTIWVQGTNNFNLPDLRGLLLRGVNWSRTNFTQVSTNLVDPDVLLRTNTPAGGNTGNAVGSLQNDQVGPHNHNIKMYTGSGGTTLDAVYVGNWAATLSTTVLPSTGLESRPKNAYVNYIIKY